MWPSLPATYASLWEEKDRVLCWVFWVLFRSRLFLLACQTPSAPAFSLSLSNVLFICDFARKHANMHTKQFLHTRSVGKLSSSASVFHIWCDSCLPLPAGSEAASVGRAECGKDNKERNDPWHRIEDSVSKGLRRHKQSLQKRRTSGVKY